MTIGRFILEELLFSIVISLNLEKKVCISKVLLTAVTFVQSKTYTLLSKAFKKYCFFSLAWLCKSVNIIQ